MKTGIGLRAPHYRDLLAERPAVGFVEVHSENYFGRGGAALHFLMKTRERYPVSLHGIGLSIGGTDAIDGDYLATLEALIARVEPFHVSDHLCWCVASGRALNDLLPLPYTEEALAHVTERVMRVQERLGRRLLLENPSSYLAYRHSTISEWDFLAAVAERADCDILLDVNNVYVSSQNLGFDPLAYLNALPAARVREMHLAGHTTRVLPDCQVLIDTHDAPVCDAVWGLFRIAAQRFPAAPALIERDANLPPLAELVAEARHADALREASHDAVAA